MMDMSLGEMFICKSQINAPPVAPVLKNSYLPSYNFNIETKV